MKSNPFIDSKYLDGEKLFRVYWLDMGNARSIGRLQKWCLSHEIVNPKTFNVPTRMGLWKTMWRWATRNQEQAKEIWIKSMGKDTSTLNVVDDWDTVIHRNAKTAFQNITQLSNYYRSIEKR